MFSQRQIEGFHKQAVTALATGDASFHPQRRFRILVSVFDDHRDDLRFLELIVMSGLYGQIGHYLTLRTLKRLRMLRIKQGEAQLFDEFQNVLVSNKQGILINNHGYGTKTFADVEKSAFFHTLQASIDEVNALGYEVSANSGTLLGLIRDKSLISFDDDVDLFVILKATSHEEAAQEYRDLGYKLSKAGHDDAVKYLQYGVIKLRKIDGFDVDLLPAYQIGQKFYVYPYSYGDLKIEDILPLAPCRISGLPIPKDPEKTLRVNYGRGWRVPDPLYAFPWLRQNEKFAALLNALAP